MIISGLVLMILGMVIHKYGEEENALEIIGTLLFFGGLIEKLT